MFILAAEKFEFKRKRAHDRKKKINSCDYGFTFVMWCGSWIVVLNVNSQIFVPVFVVETPKLNTRKRKAGICIIVLCNNFNCV